MIQNTKQPLVSIILPVSGSADGLATALESILCQTYPHFDLIIVDGGTAGTAADVAGGYQDPRINGIRHPEPCCTARALNTGISAACGELAGFIGCGDAWDERKLEEQVSCFSQLSPEYGVVYSDAWEITPAGNRAYWHSPDMDGGELLNDYATAFQAACLGTGPILVRRSILEKAGPFDMQLRSFSETDMIIRLQRLCRFHHMGQPLYCNSRSRRVSHGNPVDECIARLQFLRKYPEVLHNPLFVAHEAEMIRRTLVQAWEGIPPVPACNTIEKEYEYHRQPVPDL